MKFSSLTFFNEDNGDGAQLVPFLIDGIPIVDIRLKEDKYLISMILLNRFNIPVLKVINNELLFRNDLYDVVIKANRLLIRENVSNILIEMEFRPPNEILFHQGHLYCNGVEIIISSEDFQIVNSKNKFLGNGILQGQFGFMIGHPIFNTGIFAMPEVDRYINSGS